jgi:hypothetical protein
MEGMKISSIFCCYIKNFHYLCSAVGWQTISRGGLFVRIEGEYTPSHTYLNIIKII